MSTRCRAAIYCRLSKEDAEKHGESESIQNQKAMLAAYAEERNWEIWDIYSDEDFSGIDRERPAFRKLLKDAAAGQFEIILVKTQSRFTRDMELVEKYIHGLFPLWGIRFVAVVDNADTENRGNKKARQINGLINEWYLEDLSENIRAVLDSKRKRGQYIGSFAAYGYCKDPEDHNKLLVDEPAAEIVRSIYAMCLSGMGRQRIAECLNRQGVPNPTLYKQQQGLRYRNQGQGGWNRATIGRILKNRLYLGDMVQGKRRKASYKSKRLLSVPAENWVIVPQIHTPIIDLETFEKVQKLLQERTKAGAEGQVHPLAGKVHCMDCHRAMLKYTNIYRGKKRCYLRCAGCSQGLCTSHAVRLDLVEEEVRHRLESYLKRWGKNTVFPAGNPSSNRAGRIGKELERIKGEIDRRAKAIQGLYLDKVQGIITPEQFTEWNGAYQEEQQALKLRAAKLEKAVEESARIVRPAPLQLATLPRDLAALTIETVEIGEKDKKSGRQTIRILWNF